MSINSLAKAINVNYGIKCKSNDVSRNKGEKYPLLMVIVQSLNLMPIN
jgi:hypothetical protein